MREPILAAIWLITLPMVWWQFNVDIDKWRPGLHMFVIGLHYASFFALLISVMT